MHGLQARARMHVVSHGPARSVMCADIVHLSIGENLGRIAHVDRIGGRGGWYRRPVQLGQFWWPSAEERAAHFEAILGITKRKDFRIGSAPVTIGRRCWLGFNTAVMKGVTIGEDSIAAAGSMVLKDVPPLTLVGGNPARAIKSLAQAETGAEI